MQGLVERFLAGAADPRDPRVNPLYADLTGLGPIYIQVGGDETLLDDARRLDEHARQAGVDVRLDVFPGMLHTFQMAAGPGARGRRRDPQAGRLGTAPAGPVSRDP